MPQDIAVEDIAVDDIAVDDIAVDKEVEATPGIEPGYTVLQTVA